LVEGVVFLLLDLVLGPQPDRGAAVEYLLVRFLLPVGLLLGDEDDRVFDEIAVAFHDLAGLPIFEEFLGVLLEMKNDVGAARGLFDLFYGVFALTVGFPLHAL